MRFAARALTSLLLALVSWAAAAPIATLTCVPGSRCPLGSACSEMRPPPAPAGSLTTPDCCQRTESNKPPATLQQQISERRANASALVSLPPSRAWRVLVSPPALARTDGAGRLRPPPSTALYTLHSILLI